MKNIKVKMNTFTPSKVIIEAVGMPYDIDKPTIEIVNKVVGLYKHDSVSEHTVFNFTINGISRAILQELVRHRIASMTVKSTRFALAKILKEFGIITDTKVVSIDGLNELSNYVVDCFLAPDKSDKTSPKDYDWFMRKLKITNLDCLENMNEAKKRGFTSDYYKYFLTENLRVNLSWTINLRSLLNFLSLRLDKSAHFEIRHLATLIKSEVCRAPYIRNLIKLIDDRMTVDKILKHIKTYKECYHEEAGSQMETPAEIDRNYTSKIEFIDDLIEYIKDK